MRQFDEMRERNVRESFKSTLLLLMFGLGALGFLVAADHPEWFRIRPASGVSAAMSKAAQDNSHRKPPAQIDKGQPRSAMTSDNRRAL